jgi:lysylphosphatidylglycerol synthetase-like protein (DUF2156 family)
MRRVVLNRTEDGELVERAVVSLVQQYGGSVAHALFDGRHRVFHAPDIQGAVGYSESWRCAVAIGDPVCRLADLPLLAVRFRAYCAAHGEDTVYAAASARLAAVVCRWGGAALEFGETLIFDPRRDPQAGRRGHELRKKVAHARRAGVAVREYQPERGGREPALERTLTETVAQWLAARHGAQLYLSRVRLFEPRFAWRRLFYARASERVVGVLSLLRMEARGGYLVEHLLAIPAAPVGITELLVTECFASLAAEGCSFATFGPVPSGQIGDVQNLRILSELMARKVFSTASGRFHLTGRAQFQHKFQNVATEPVYLVFDPPHIALRDIVGVMRAFNFSVR